MRLSQTNRRKCVDCGEHVPVGQGYSWRGFLMHPSCLQARALAKNKDVDLIGVDPNAPLTDETVQRYWQIIDQGVDTPPSQRRT